MRQLTSLDAQFLAIEDDRNHGHVGSIAIYDPSTAPGGIVTLDDLKRTLGERLHLLEPFRWRLVQVPFGLDHPYWLDGEVDLDYHVRELALPAPGDIRQLADQTARIFERALDRDHPLWEIYLIQGLQDGKIGVLTKVHHAALDGLSGAEILVTLLDLEPTGREIPPADPDHRPATAPGSAELLARGLAGMPRHTVSALRTLPSTLPNLDLVPTLRSLPGVATLAGVSRRVAGLIPGQENLATAHPQAPKTSLNRRISGHRRVALTSVSLSEVKAIKNHLGVTVNDVVIALTAGAVRQWLITHDEIPAEPLLAMVPVSVRLPEEFGTYGNRVSMMVAAIPTDTDDPAERVRLAHEEMLAAKSRHQQTPRMLMQEAYEVIPPMMMAGAARALFAMASTGAVNPPMNLVISNVPGSPVPLYCMGAQLEANYPLSAITDGIGLNLTIISYMDRIDFGIVGDREEVPDVWFLADEIDRAYEELRALLPAAGRRQRARPTVASAAPEKITKPKPVMP